MRYSEQPAPRHRGQHLDSGDHGSKSRRRVRFNPGVADIADPDQHKDQNTANHHPVGYRATIVTVRHEHTSHAETSRLMSVVPKLGDQIIFVIVRELLDGVEDSRTDAFFGDVLRTLPVVKASVAGSNERPALMHHRGPTHVVLDDAPGVSGLVMPKNHNWIGHA